MAFIVPYIGNVIIPTDFHIFQRGRSTTNQQCKYPQYFISIPTYIKAMAQVTVKRPPQVQMQVGFAGKSPHVLIGKHQPEGKFWNFHV